MANWTASDIPSQAGRSAIVTGTGGLGIEDALALARAGAEVIIAGRSPAKGADAMARIRQEVGAAAKVRFEPLDLADLGSVREFGARMRRERDGLDLLINNAGVMVPPERKETADGFELQFGTNYLGHFALTAQLMPLLRRRRGARVISVSSIAARQGRINFDDLNATASYKPMDVYSQSKIACLMFAFELQRRSEAGRWGITSVAAHPGVARTELLNNAPGKGSAMSTARSLLWFLFQPVWQGALPTLYAATAPGVAGGSYWGPDKLSETRGYPAPAKVPAQALDRAVAERLWDESERLAGVTFEPEMAA
ncbi:SDR family oxidoreductase [Devosia sp. CN2-171]|uniref:SDR family oxidoreductase n=1 Tax=Devosia sp. CN2-171 TaxID=3400909 RepID=UPI003BF89AF9